jgi:GH3 auxin-responsive promoter
VAALLAASLRLGAFAAGLRFRRATARPEVAQAAVLRALLRRNADTVFGRHHSFARIRDARDYAAAVPVRDFEGFRPFVDRIVAGEPAVLTAEAPVMFTTTSGTTGQPKLIPVTPTWQAEMTGLMRLWMRGVLQDHPTAFAGDALTLVSPAIEGWTPGGLPIGALSGVAYQRIPRPVRRQYAVPYAAQLIADPDTRYFVIMRLALARSVSVVGTPNATSLVRLADTAATRGEALIRAIHDGDLGVARPALTPASGLSPADVGWALIAPLRPDPGRARALERVAAAAGLLRPGDAWAGLRLVACWLGGTAGLHARRLADPYGEVPLRDLGLIASEGRITVPLEDGSAAGVLAVHAGFYEFVDEARIDEPDPPVRLAHELVDGGRYYVLLTGWNGLYRYDLNDIVEVQGFHGATPRLAFVRKGRDMVSITGEKLHVNQVLAALREAEDVARLPVWQFRLIPDVDACRYDLLVEPHGEAPAEEPARALLRAFDEALCRLNVEYAGKRASRRLGPPRLQLMRAGWSERAARADVARGQREIQYKWAAIRLAWDEISRADRLRTLDPVPGPVAAAPREYARLA